MRRFELEWRLRFERFAHEHSADHLVSGWSEAGLAQRLENFGSLFSSAILPVPGIALDLGCGPGTYVRFLGRKGVQIVGVDYALSSLRRAAQADSQLVGQYINGEAYHLPFGDQCFDLVVCIGVLQSLECPHRVLDEIIRVVRPNGFVVLDFLNAWEIVAQGKWVLEKIRGQPARLRTYTSPQIRSWLVQRGISPIKLMGVYLAPSRFPWAKRILRNEGILKTIELVPGLSLVCAHAFMIVGRKKVLAAGLENVCHEAGWS